MNRDLILKDSNEIEKYCMQTNPRFPHVKRIIACDLRVIQHILFFNLEFILILDYKFQ